MQVGNYWGTIKHEILKVLVKSIRKKESLLYLEQKKRSKSLMTESYQLPKVNIVWRGGWFERDKYLLCDECIWLQIKAIPNRWFTDTRRTSKSRSGFSRRRGKSSWGGLFLSIIKFIVVIHGIFGFFRRIRGQLHVVVRIFNTSTPCISNIAVRYFIRLYVYF